MGVRYFFLAKEKDYMCFLFWDIEDPARVFNAAASAVVVVVIVNKNNKKIDCVRTSVLCRNNFYSTVHVCVCVCVCDTQTSHTINIKHPLPIKSSHWWQHPCNLSTWVWNLSFSQASIHFTTGLSFSLHLKNLIYLPQLSAQTVQSK